MDLVVPVKPLTAAKSRLLGAADNGIGDAGAHARLALALAHDTVAAVRGARRVRHLIVISSDAVVAASMAAHGVEVVPDGPTGGLNPAYTHGEALLRGRHGPGAVGALQADLPALAPAELDAALDAALAVFALGAAARAFITDTDGTGTTLLVAAPGTALDPRFGLDSALRHQESGAAPLTGRWPGLRRYW